MKVAAIVLNYNSSADCRKCVADLKCQEGVELEIVIVDNCSREDEAHAVRQLAEVEGCTFIEAKENRGYNAGNNIGLRYAAEKGYEYALIANPDMEFPQRDYVVRLVNVMENKPDVAVCGSNIVKPDGKHQNPLREANYWEELFWFYPIWLNRKSGNWLLCDYNQSRYCEKISGCCLMVRMTFIVKNNFFDENVFLYSEEPILSKQVQLAKAKIYYVKNAIAIHNHLETAKGDIGRRLQLSFISRKYYFCKYSGYKGIKLYLLLASKKVQQTLYKLITWNG